MYRFLGYILSIFFLLIVSMEAFAQVKDTTFVGAQVIEEQPVENDFIVGEIRVVGNKRTKPQMLYRELLFAEGDTIKANEWMQIRKQSAENLFNTSLFNSVGIKVISSQTQIRDIEISVVERWYIWPVPVFEIDERNFNTWWETKDLSRASAGVFLTHNNFRGRREVLKVLLMAGYNQKLGFSYTAPYVNKKKTIGVGFQTIYTLRHEVNHKTEYDKQQYLKLTDEPIQRDLLASVHVTYRPNYFFTAFLQLRYRHYEFADSLLKANPNYAPTTDNQMQYMTMYGKFKFDRRDYKSYPLAGYYVDLEMRNRGLGFFDDEVDVWSVQTTMRKYWTLSQRWYYAASFTGKIGGSASAGTQQAYLFDKALGYGRDYVRTYQYYVVDGRSFGLLKMNLKYALIPPRKVKLDFIKTDKFNTIPYAFYLNAFFDAGYVDNPHRGITNILPDRAIYGTGLGLDFVTYYDAVARFEFGVNHMGEVGFFLSFIAPI